MAFPDGWQKRAPLVIQASEVPATQTDFPVLFTEENLPSEIFEDAQADGGDIRFTADEAGIQQLAAHVQRFAPGSPNDAYIRVKVPSLSASSGTTIYVWYSTEGTESQPAVTDAFGRNAVYSNGFEAFWPLEEDGDGTVDEYEDATGSGHHGQGGGGTASRVPAQTDGQVGFGQDFTRADDQQINCGDDAGLDLTGAFTISGWIQPGLADTAMIIYGRASFNNNGIRFGTLANNSDIDLWTFQDGGNTRYIWPNSLPPSPIHVVVVRDGGSATLYIDGQEITPSAAPTLADPVSSPQTAFIGAGGSAGTAENFDGLIDELRVASVARTQSWAQTEFNNEKDPGAFVVAGTPEDVGQEPRQEPTDFSEYPSDQAPADWSEHNAASFAVVRDVSGAEGGKVLEWNHDTQERQALTWDEIGSAADAKVAIKRQRTQSARIDLRPFVRGGADATNDHYHALHDSDDNAISIGKIVDGTFTLLTSDTKALDPADWIWLELAVEGENLEARFWQDGDPRPETPDLTANDSDLSSGSVGLFHFRTTRAEVDFVTVATVGEELLFPEPPDPDPEQTGPDGTRRRASLTIQQDKIDASLSDFPVPLTGANLPVEAFAEAQADGGDLRFTSDEAGENRLDAHVIAWAPGSPNDAYVRVKVPAVADDADTEIFMWWDSQDVLSQPAPDAPFGREAVYSNGYRAFWHLDEEGDGTAEEYLDSLGVHHGQGGAGDTARVPARIDGQLRFGQQFDPESVDFVDCGSDNRLNLTGDMSLSFWLRPRSTDLMYLPIRVEWGLAGYMVEYSNNEIRYRTHQDGSFQTSRSNTEVAVDAWHHVMVARSGQTATIYIDGADETNTGESEAHQDPDPGTIPFVIATDWSGAALDGDMDEVRVAAGERSAAWARAEFESESDPGAFVVAGDAVSVAPAVVVEIEPALETNTAFEILPQIAGDVPVARAGETNAAFEIEPRIVSDWAGPVEGRTLVDVETLTTRLMTRDDAVPIWVVEIDAFRLT